MTNKSIGSSFDDFLAEEGLSDEVEAGAIKKIIACQLQETKKMGLTILSYAYLYY
jgi:hypothetical protein